MFNKCVKILAVVFGVTFVVVHQSGGAIYPWAIFAALIASIAVGHGIWIVGVWLDIDEAVLLPAAFFSILSAAVISVGINLLVLIILLILTNPDGKQWSDLVMALITNASAILGGIAGGATFRALITGFAARALK